MGNLEERLDEPRFPIRAWPGWPLLLCCPAASSLHSRMYPHRPAAHYSVLPAAMRQGASRGRPWGRAERLAFSPAASLALGNPSVPPVPTHTLTRLDLGAEREVSTESW